MCTHGPYDKSTLDAVARGYGYSLHEFTDEDANDIIAVDFQRKANDFLSKHCSGFFSIYNGRIYVEVAFVEPGPEKILGIEILVVPVDNSTVHCFAIFISIKALVGISSLFASLSLGPERINSEEKSRFINERFASELFPKIIAALTFIFFHELAHILRGHLPYFLKDEYWTNGGDRKVAFHLINEDVEPNWTKRATIRALEMDADLVAFGLFLELFNHPELINTELVPPELFRNISLAGEAVYVLIRLLEVWRRESSQEPYDPDNTPHPHPDIRQIFYESWLRARKKDKSFSPELLQAFMAGSNRAQQILEMFGHDILPNMEYLIDEGTENVISEYDILVSCLEGKVRPELKRFSVQKP
ncbi:hypothetical protein [Siphonobacter sp. SORGH_AS_1065]|uniref:hypothetical protein n=1 Tax=Siphonobacter sp. SORGH_AS_1065 TaxID=3041795 RepID=UPI002789D371|nr:hypothetical protein [Siphonobacter sp. SORGH_AS_1065]MDQ1087110.1 hypothetical protein [Siphonobacter sp. SORGH_AS_1065]